MNIGEYVHIWYVHHSIYKPKIDFHKLLNFIDKEEDNNVSVSDQLRKELQRRKDEAELKRRLELVDSLGEDFYEDGTVIKWEKQLWASDGEPGCKRYTYVALKAGKRWYITGRAGSVNGLDWTGILDQLLAVGVPTETFQVAKPQDFKGHSE